MIFLGLPWWSSGEDSALPVQSLNHWTTREVPVLCVFDVSFLIMRYLVVLGTGQNKVKEKNFFQCFSLLQELILGFKHKM